MRDRKDKKLTLMVSDNLNGMLELMTEKEGVTVSFFVRRLIRDEFERGMPRTEGTKNVYKLVEQLTIALRPIAKEAADVKPVLDAIEDLEWAIDNWEDSLRAVDTVASMRKR